MDQFPENDLSRARSQEFGFPLYPTIAETLRCGGDKLDVDGVLLIGEHGKYPVNELGQTLYPRYEFFREIVEVFKQDGRTVPVFNDKHLSWKWEWSKEMVETAHAMGFPLLAGSSLPVTFRMPAIDLPFGAEIEEVMCVAIGGVDSYDFHALETIQCMVERRRGGETGVDWLQAMRGEPVWEAMGKGLFREPAAGIRSSSPFLPLSQPHPGPGGNDESSLSQPGSRFSNGSRSRWSTVTNTPTA